MSGFTPLSAMIGGALIGLAAGLVWLVHGRVASLPSLLDEVQGCARHRLWQLLFLAGLPVGAAVGFRVGPSLVPEMPSAPLSFDIGPVGFAAAGLLVGVGAELARSGMSDPGIFGLARLSHRSLMAVSTAALAAIIAVYVQRYML